MGCYADLAIQAEIDSFHSNKLLVVKGSFRCSCGKCFRTAGALDDHAKSKKCILYTKCALCEKVFSTQEGLTQHKEDKHGIKTSN